MKFWVLAVLFLAVIATCSAQAPDAQAGAVLFRDNCARCHDADLEDSKKVPALAEIRKKKHWTDERITKQILNGEGQDASLPRISLRGTDSAVDRLPPR